MKTGIRVRAEYPVSRWSGGTTTEILIWPPDASYEKRRFLFRISSAAVEAEESDFTRLPGVWRILMVLEGEVRLQCGNGEPVLLHAFESHEFSGGVDTKSFGICRDFNLMMKEGCSGRLKVMDFPGENHYNKARSVFLQERSFLVMYMAEKSGRILVPGMELILNTGDCFWAYDGSGEIQILGETGARIVTAEIGLPETGEIGNLE